MAVRQLLAPLHRLLGRMVETDILTEVKNEETEECTYQPALDSHRISVGMVAERIEAQGSEQFIQSPTAEMQAFWERYLALKEKRHSEDKILLNEL